MEARASSVVVMVIVKALTQLDDSIRLPGRGQGKGPDEPQPNAQPLFRSVLRLLIPHANLTPSIPQMQRAVNQIAAAVLSVSKLLPVWSFHVGTGPFHAVASSTTGPVRPGDVPSTPGDLERLMEMQRQAGLAKAPVSLFGRVSNSREVLRIVLKIAGALGGLDRRCSSVVHRLSRFDFLWQVRGMPGAHTPSHTPHTDTQPHAHGTHAARTPCTFVHSF